VSQNSRWYIVNVYAGYEKKLVEFIRDQSHRKGLESYFEDFFIPAEEVIVVRKDRKKVPTERNFFPGYVLIKMQLTDETWHLIKSSPRVNSFLGSKGKPTPISEGEVTRIMKQVQDSLEKSIQSVYFEVGEQVRICRGPFASFMGMIDEVDSEKSRLTLSVSIFGRSTPVELEFDQVEKM
jgi:transcriptional antiterminator NusG